MLKVFGLALLSLIMTTNPSAADIAAQNAWSLTVTRDDLVSGAGSNLRASIDSGAVVLTLDITNTGGANWTVLARRSDVTWPTGTGLSMKRTSDGSGSGSISGGTAYAAVGLTDQTVFTGSGDRTGVRVQYRLDNLSVQAGYGNFGTTIVYTIQ